MTSKIIIIFRKKIDLDNYGNKIKTIIIGILAILFTYLSFLLFLNTQKGIYLSCRVDEDGLASGTAAMVR